MKIAWQTYKRCDMLDKLAAEGSRLNISKVCGKPLGQMKFKKNFKKSKKTFEKRLTNQKSMWYNEQALKSTALKMRVTKFKNWIEGNDFSKNSYEFEEEVSVNYFDVQTVPQSKVSKIMIKV